jgi:serine/threonine protein kinase
MPAASDTALSVLHFFDPPEEFSYLTRDDPTAFAPPPAFGPFRVLHQVGVGALGPVFRTYEPTRDRLVAVKVFRLDITPEHAQSLADALSSAAEAGLFHPSIVEPIASGIEGTVAYRAEEYIAAESLDVALRHYAPASIEKVLPFITQLAGAIDFARAAGVGHGALHPRDIFVTPEEARATGFGVVEALEKVGLRAPVRRPYSAPERVDGKPWGVAADVFALAAITYELLTAKRPSGTGSAFGELGEFGGEHTGAMQTVFARAMDDDSGKRYPTALAFVSALEAAARDGKSAERVTASAPPAIPVASAAAAVTAAAATAKPNAAEPEPPPTDDQIDDTVTAMPPAVVPDEQQEPAATALEEDVFRAEPPTLDDLADVADVEDAEDKEEEADDDDLDFALARGAEREGGLFDAVDDDFDLAPTPPRFVNEFEAEPAEKLRDEAPDDEVEADEEEAEEVAEQPVRSTLSVTPAFEPPIIAPASRGYSSITDPAPVPERSRTPILPYALILMLGLFLGWTGHMYSTRNANPNPTAAPPPAAPAPQQPQGKEFSEQTVTPAPQQAGRQPTAEPPAVPPEVPNAPATPPRAEPKPPAAAPTTGTIVVNSTPPGAGVTVDGKWSGRTPLTLDKLKFGSYTIRIVQDGYSVERHVVPLNSQSPSRTVTAKLQPLAGTKAAAKPPAKPKPQPTAGTGSLFVDSRPRGARVFVDDKPVGVTPLQLKDLSTGDHSVRLELVDHQTWRTTTSVAPGRQARVSGSLERIR